jgi:hypothetical protein
MTDEPIQFGGSPHRLSGWLLFLLHDATRLGLAPISQENLHLLLFYSAVLAPVHALEEPVPKILKHNDRPFYPEAHDELLRLVVCGFIDATTRRSIRDDGWSGGSYSISADGIRVISLLKHTRWGERTAEFVKDLVTSFAELDPEETGHLIGQDATYRDDRLSRGEIRDLRKDNQAALAARLIADYEVDGVRPGPRDSIALYFDFLQARRAA